MYTVSILPPRPRRVSCPVEVRLLELDRPQTVLTGHAKALNVSENGLLMELVGQLDAVAGEEVAVSLLCQGGTFETTGTIVRFDSPYRGDPARHAVALRLRDPIPARLIPQA